MTRWMQHLFAAMVLIGVASGSGAAVQREFRLGIISDKPVEKKIAGYGPFAKYVAQHLKAFGVTDGRVVVANDLDEMLQKIKRREVDVVFESPFSTLMMKDKAGMKPELLVWKHGVRSYRSIFFVRKDSPIAKLADLKGKLLALQDPGSTSAFLIPTTELLHKGLKVAPANPDRAAGVVSYVMVRHEKNQAFWVIKKKADAGAFGDDDWEDLTDEEKADLKVIYRSNPVLRFLASFHPALPPDLAKAISDTLTAMDRDAEGRKILQDASQTRKITPLTAADRDSLAYVRRLMQAP